MRHALDADLDRVDALLASLRAVVGLVEKKRGTFYRGSKAFLHFHEHGGEIVCDVKLDGVEFERRIVRGAASERALVRDVRAALAAP